MTPEEFRAFGHQLIDWIADYRARVGERPVRAQTSPGDIIRALPAAPPESPESFDAILADVDRIVMPGITHWQHPALDRKSTRLNSSHIPLSRMPSSA